MTTSELKRAAERRIAASEPLVPKVCVAAYELAKGDTILETDGFTWRVIETEFDNGRYRVTVEPVMGSMTARGARTISLRRSANVWILRQAA